MRRTLPLALAVLVGGGSLAADTGTAAKPAPAAPAKTTYKLAIGGEELGTEDAAVATTAEGRTLTSSVHLTLPGGQAALTQDLRLKPDGALISYVLDIDAPGQQITLKTTPTDDGVSVGIFSKGGDSALQTKPIALKAPYVLIDNNFASHLDLYTRTLGDLGPGGERSFSLLVPQVVQSIPAVVKRLADGTATLDGKPVATRGYRITVANLTEELVASASDGALLRVEVPLQRLTIVRAGVAFAPAPAEKSSAAPQKSGDSRETEVTVKGPAGELPAVLLVPKREKPVPGVVLLSGSGPNDRDETIGPNKPFRDIANGLADRGIATLRFDKRTHALKAKAKATLAAEYFEDATAAIKLLAATPGVDPERVFVLGHSEGAMLAPTIGGQNEGIRGLVLMAPGIRPIDAMIIDQLAFGAKLTGRSEDEIAEQTKTLKDQFAAIRDPKRADAPAVMGAPAAYWRELLAIDVTKTVKDSKLPILVLQGDEDIQVRKDLDFNALKSSVGDAGGRVAYQSFASLNHLFMRVDGRSSGAEYGIPGHVEPSVPNAIADWILAR